jgi:hypothetical protein
MPDAARDERRSPDETGAVGDVNRHEFLQSSFIAAGAHALKLTGPAEQGASAGFLEAAARGAAEAVELARFVETSTIAAGTLETLDETVERFAQSYSRSRPELLIPRIKRQLRYVKHLLGTPVTLTQRRHLIVDGGWLALLLACVQFDVGDKPAAEASRDAAYQLGREAAIRS